MSNGENLFDLLGNSILPTGRPQQVTGTKDYAVVPENFKIVDLEDYCDRPRRTAHRVVLDEAESFVAYVRKFTGPQSAVFASRNPTRLKAILDYDGPNSPAWGEHVASYEPRHSFEWQRVQAQINKGLVDQEPFARFIEENTAIIRKPAAADMLQLSREIAVKKSVDFGEALHLDSGATELRYVETIKASGNTKAGVIDIPDGIDLQLPIYIAGEVYTLRVELRYRLQEKRLKLAIEMLYVSDLLEAAHLSIIAKLRAQLSSVAFFSGSL